MAEEQVLWIDARGVVLPFDGSSGVALLVGRTGLWMPPFELVEFDRPMHAGTRVVKVKTGPRDYDLPLLFQGASYEASYALLKSALGHFDPTRGPGTLRVVDPNGDSRELPEVYYTGGLEMAESWPDWSPTHYRAVASFHAPDPYWYDVGDTTATYASDVATAPTFFPFFPLRLSAGTVLTSPTLVNDGDVELWPIFTVTGPGTDLLLLNTTTGKFLSMPVVIAADEQVVIDTRPGHKTVTDAEGRRLFGSLSATSELWPFPVGASTFQVQMNGANAASQVQVRYRRRFYSP